MAATIAQLLVRRLHGLPASEIPLRVLARTVLCMEDTVGVALAALSMRAGTPGVRVARESGGGPVTVWGAGFSAGLDDAVLANGMLSHAIDFDDLHAAAVMHSSAPIVAATLGLAQVTAASARDMLAAAVVGYEVAARLGRLAPGAFQRYGFQSTAVLGTFATAAIAARLLRLNDAQALNAFGIAGSMASGLMEFLSDGSDAKQMHPGWSALAGVRAARLAKAGMSGPASVFEGRDGVFLSFARTEVSAARVDTPLGAPWEVECMSPKPYPACLCVHPQVQAMLQLREQGAIAADRVDEIEEIACEVPELYARLVHEPASEKVSVRTPYAARFSAPYCMARALLDGRLDMMSFSEAALADPRARAIARRVTHRVVELAEYPDSFPARVRVRLSCGAVHEVYVAHNVGSPGNPMDASRIGAKFLACAGPAVGNAAAARLQQAFRSLPEAATTGVLLSALARATVAEAAWN